MPEIVRILADPGLAGRTGLERDRPLGRSRASITREVEEVVDSEHGAAWVADLDGVVGFAVADWWWDSLIPWAHVVIAPEHRRQGHGTTLTRLLFDHLFLGTPALLVQFGVPSWDEPGLAFATSLGGELVGRKRRVGVRAGRYFDRAEYIVTRTTWEERHAARG